MTEGLTIEDVAFAYTHALACRHVSGNEAFYSHRTKIIYGDSYAIGAADIFLYPEHIRRSDFALSSAVLQRTESPVDGIRAQGDRLLAAYKQEMRKMVEQSVVYDHNHTDATECRFMIYRDVNGVISPRDMDTYPFGKCGQELLDPDKFCVGIFLSSDERNELRGNIGGIVDCLTNKLLDRLHRFCEAERTSSPKAAQAGVGAYDETNTIPTRAR